MFTGIVEDTGEVASFSRGAEAWRLVVAAPRAARGVAIGDSVAVNGCCLTVVKAGAGLLGFDLLEETRSLTNLSDLRSGAAVNLERSLRVDGRIGGHFVTGHIDGKAKIDMFEARGRDHYLRVRPPAEGFRYLVPKGSVAIDGISLTVAEVNAERFAVWIIPHTLAVTCLRERKVGDAVNLEYDMLGKYVENLLKNTNHHANRPRGAHRRAAPAQSGRDRLRRGPG